MMEKYKISADEFKSVSFLHLATHPNSSSKFGEGKMSAEKLKSRFDAPGKLFREKFNALVELIVGDQEGEESLAMYISTGIAKGKSLKDLFEDITSENGTFASYLSVGTGTLLQKLIEIDQALEGLLTMQSETLEKLLEVKVNEATERFDEKASEASAIIEELNTLKNDLSEAIAGGAW